MFDAIAHRYDFLNHFLSAGIDRRWRRRAIRSVALSGQDRVLDLCSGTADLAIAAATSHPAARRLIGVDFADAMLRRGQHKLRAQQLTDRVSLVRGDATHLPLATESVDVVTIGFGIRNVEGTGQALDEIYRVLRRGGRLAILEFATPPNPLVRSLYRWYSSHVLPRVGRLLSRHNEAYGYLPASIEAFATPQQLSVLLETSGFRPVVATPLTLGVVFLYSARKP